MKIKESITPTTSIKKREVKKKKKYNSTRKSYPKTLSWFHLRYLIYFLQTFVSENPPVATPNGDHLTIYNYDVQYFNLTSVLGSKVLSLWSIT